LQVAKVDGHIVQLSHGEPQDGSKQTATPWHFAEQSGPPKCQRAGTDQCTTKCT
jgi:hypothetical protein